MSNKATNTRLLADRLIVEVISREEVTAGGILIPEAGQSKESASVGKVINISSQIKDNNETAPEEKVELGDEIFYSKYAGSALFVQGREYKILRITDVHGVI